MKKKKTDDRVRRTIRLPEQLDFDLQVLASKRGCSFNAIVILMAQQIVEMYKQKTAKK